MSKTTNNNLAVAAANEYKTKILNYLDEQLRRKKLPVDSQKHKSFEEVRKDLLKNDYTIEVLQAYVGKIKMIASKHRDTGIWGICKATMFRNPTSFNALNS